MNIVLTYGTFDLFHFGHYEILRRAAEFGQVHVGVSTDEFNKEKGKVCEWKYDQRVSCVASQPFVHAVFPEETWDQKVQDIKRIGATIFIMGNDWTGKFDHLSDLVQVLYLPRTPGISSTLLRTSKYH